MSTPKVLFLGANGRDTTKLQLGAEVRDIKQGLAISGVGHAFDLVTELAVRPSDLQSLLLSHSPHVLHFSGHGVWGEGRRRRPEAPNVQPDSERRGGIATGNAKTPGTFRDFLPADDDAIERAGGGLLLEDAHGSAVHLRPDMLLAMLSILKRDMPLRCVVLNACFTAEQAEAIAEHVDCVVGTAREIDDDAALAFATAFYRAIAHGKSVADAFSLGRNEIGLRRLPGEDVPRLFCRTGIAAEHVFVVKKAAHEFSKALDATTEQEKLARDIEKRLSELTKHLQDKHQLCAKLAGKLGTTNTCSTIAETLLHSPAFAVATCLADLDAATDIKPADRDTVRKMLWETLPLAIDWRDVLNIARKNLDEGHFSVELPLRTETMAEVILAGADGRACSLVNANPYPQGLARISMPSTMFAPFFQMEQHAVNVLVKQLVDEKTPGVRAFEGYRGLPTQTDEEIEEARVLVDELLADWSRKDNPDRLPHYLLFIDHLFRKDSSVDLDKLWLDLSRACAVRLPHLRLFRLKGGPKEFGKEIKVVLQIQKPLHKV